MRKLLLLALLLYDIVTSASRPRNYDYEDVMTNKQHSFYDRRNLRKKALQNPLDSEPRDWGDRGKYENYPKYSDDLDVKHIGGMDAVRPPDQSGSIYKDYRRYDESNKLTIPPNFRSSELDHAPSILENGVHKKNSMTMNCERPHERFEACFAGCASVTCDNPRERLRPCYPFCEPGCVCTHPYVRDDRTHKCVLPEDCSKGLKGIPDLGEDV